MNQFGEKNTVTNFIICCITIFLLKKEAYLSLYCSITLLSLL